jgi:hypothetical protein
MFMIMRGRRRGTGALHRPKMKHGGLDLVRCFLAASSVVIFCAAPFFLLVHPFAVLTFYLGMYVAFILSKMIGEGW